MKKEENNMFAEDDEIYIPSKTIVLYTNADISSLIDDLITNINKTRESSYTKLFALFSIDIHIAKVNALTVS
jgi:hypothetical protein